MGVTTDTAGMIQFEIRVKIQEMGEWEVERIRRFFAGIAQALAASEQGPQELDIAVTGEKGGG